MRALILGVIVGFFFGFFVGAEVWWKAKREEKAARKEIARLVASRSDDCYRAYSNGVTMGLSASSVSHRCRSEMSKQLEGIATPFDLDGIREVTE